jgi:hypothetical protein
MHFNLYGTFSIYMFIIGLQGYQISILINLIGYDLISTTCSIDLTMVASTTNNSFF